MASFISDIQIRRLHPQDSKLAVEALRVLKAPEGGSVPSKDYTLEFLSRSENVLIVATKDKEPVGFIVAYLLDRVDRNQKMMFFYEVEEGEKYRRRGTALQQ